MNKLGNQVYDLICSVFSFQIEEDSFKKRKKKWDDFLQRGFNSENVVNFLNDPNEEAFHNKYVLLHQILKKEFSEANYFFTEIFENYLGAENVKDNILNFIKSVEKTYGNGNVIFSNIINLCEKNSVLRDVLYEGNDNFIEDLLNWIISNLEDNKEIKNTLYELLIKESIFKRYILERENNLLVEYLSQFPSDNINLKTYRALESRLPELYGKKNKYGVLDTLTRNKTNKSNYVRFNAEDKRFRIIKDLPLTMKISSEPDNIMNWINDAVFYRLNISDNAFYDLLFDLLSSSIKEVMSDGLKKKEVEIKFTIQHEIRKKVGDYFFKKGSESGQKEIMALIEHPLLDSRAIKNFGLVDVMIMGGYLDKSYKEEVISRVEKRLLLEKMSGDFSESAVIRKRM